MSQPEDPARLVEDGSLPTGLRAALRAARDDVGTDAQLASLSERLGGILGPAEPVPAAAARAGMSGAAKLGVGAATLVLIGAGFWLSRVDRTGHPAATPLPRASQPALVVASTSPPAEPSARVAEPDRAKPADTPAADTLAGPSAMVPATSPIPPRKAASAPAASEAELLEQARAALQSDPARALARTSEHRARFPRGVLVQEREVIAIQALRQLGRGAEADKRAEAFSKAFPGSAFQRKLKPSP